MKFIVAIPSIKKESPTYYANYTLEEVLASEPSQVILVPTLEDYHAVRGQLFLAGSDRKVACLIPPSVYSTKGSLPYMLVSDDYQHDGHFDGEYRYYYVKK